MPKKFDRSLIPQSPNLHFEQVLWQAGMVYVAGIDEAGRGALAGPVAAGVVILPDKHDLVKTLHGVRDSKELPAKQREHWAGIIEKTALACGVGFAEPEEIDDQGIIPATRLAALRALSQLSLVPQHLLIDYLSIPEAGLPETSLVKGDARCLSIASASILAKVARDEFMEAAEDEYPGYKFASNKGYGTQAHRDAIAELGPCPIHRRSYSLFSEAEGE